MCHPGRPGRDFRQGDLGDEWQLCAPTALWYLGIGDSDNQHKEAFPMRFFNIARHWFWIAPVVLGIAFIVGGLYMVSEGGEAKDEVRDALIAENIVTPEDASIPSVQVKDAATARAQADIIEEHYLKLTGGKTYAELDREDPNRQTAFTAANLRTSLNLAVMGFKVSDLVIGMGLFMAAIGATFVLLLAPAVYYAAEVANDRSRQESR